MANNVVFFSSKFSPPCRMVGLTLEALGIAHEYKEVDLASGEHKSPEYLAVNPEGKVPGLKDGDFCLGESRAIIQYLCNKYGKDDSFYPKDAQERALVEQVLYIDERVIEALYKFVKPYQVLFLNQKPGLGDEAELKKALGSYEALLSKRKFLAGDKMSIADFSAVGSLSLLDLCRYNNLDDLPNLKKWLACMKKLPYYGKAVAKNSKAVEEIYQKKINS